MNIAMVSPQGTLVYQHKLYKARQGETDEEGGQVGYVMNYAKELANLGHNVHIYARDYNNTASWIEKPKDHPNLSIIHIATSASPDIQKEQFYPYYPEWLADAIDIIEQNDFSYDVINGHYADGIFLAARMADYFEIEKGKRPLLAGTTHSLGYAKIEAMAQKRVSNTDKSELKHAFAQDAEDYNFRVRLGTEIGCFHDTDILFRVSGAENRLITRKYGYEGPVVLMPGGLNPNIFKPYTDEERSECKPDVIKFLASKAGRNSSIDWDAARIIFDVGRLNEQKGVYQGVRAMRRILEKNKDAVFVFAGGNIPPRKGAEKEVYEKCVTYAHKHGFADRLVFTGKLEHEKIADIYNVADVALFPQLLEPYGMVIIEAAACGTPVVVSTKAGAAEDLEDGVQALHVNPYKPDDIADKVLQVLSDPKLAQNLSINGARRAGEFTWKERARYYLEALNALAPQTNPHHKAHPACRFMGRAYDTMTSLMQAFKSSTANDHVPALEKAENLIRRALIDSRSSSGNTPRTP